MDNTEDIRSRNPTEGMSKRDIELRKRKARAGRNRRAKKQSVFSEYSYHIVVGSFVVICIASIVFVLSQKKTNLKTTPVIDFDAIEEHNSAADRYDYTFKIGSNEFFTVMSRYNAS